MQKNIIKLCWGRDIICHVSTPHIIISLTESFWKLSVLSCCWLHISKGKWPAKISLQLLISAPSLGVIIVNNWLCLSGCPSVMPLQMASFLFLDGIEPFFGLQFSVCPSTKLFSLIFDLGPLKPKNLLFKITYESACMADRPEMFEGFGDGRFNEIM